MSEYPPVKAEITAAIELLRQYGYEVTLPEPTPAGMVTFDDYEAPPKTKDQIEVLHALVERIEFCMVGVWKHLDMPIYPGSSIDEIVRRVEDNE